MFLFHPLTEQVNIETKIDNGKINLWEINGGKTLGIQGSTQYFMTWTWTIFNSIRVESQLALSEDKTIKYSNKV